MPVVVATITPKPGEQDAVRAALLDAIPQVHAEPGCELYALHEGDGSFVMVERWASDEALAVHGRADAFQGFLAAIDGKLAGRLDVRLVTPVPAGDPEKGAV